MSMAIARFVQRDHLCLSVPPDRGVHNINSFDSDRVLWKWGEKFPLERDLSTSL